MRRNSAHESKALRCTEPFIIVIPSSRYVLNNVERDAKHQTIIIITIIIIITKENNKTKIRKKMCLPWGSNSRPTYKVDMITIMLQISFSSRLKDMHSLNVIHWSVTIYLPCRELFSWRSSLPIWKFNLICVNEKKKKINKTGQILHPTASTAAKLKDTLTYTIRFEPAHDKTYNKTCMSSKDSDHPVHQFSMVRAVVYPSLNSLEAVERTCGQRWLWSDCADVQADLSLRWSH